MEHSFTQEQLDAVDEALYGLIEKGLVKITGVNENGELLYHDAFFISRLQRDL